MSEESIYNRLIIYINHLGITTGDFAKSIATSPSVLSNLGNKTSNTVFYKIYSAYPQLSPRWLQLGEGEMLRTVTMAKTTYDEAKRGMDGTAEDDYLIIQQKRIKAIIADIFESRSIVEKQLELHSEELRAKDEQISRLIKMVEQKDLIIATLIDNKK